MAVVCFLKKSIGYKKVRFCETFFSIMLVLILIYQPIYAQSSTAFTPADKFSYPDSNSALNFSTEGSYELARFENGAWMFVNLLLNRTEQEMLNLTVSANDSDLTITEYRRFNTTFQGLILSYIVDGKGEQSFDFGFAPEEGGWTVLFNEDLVSEGDGWSTFADSNLTVTGATANATILYLSYSNFFGEDNSNKSFYERHSVAIIATVLVSATLIVAAIIRLRLRHTKKVINTKRVK
jgi:hypothetical protein